MNMIINTEKIGTTNSANSIISFDKFFPKFTVMLFLFNKLYLKNMKYF